MDWVAQNWFILLLLLLFAGMFLFRGSRRVIHEHGKDGEHKGHTGGHRDSHGCC